MPSELGALRVEINAYLESYCKDLPTELDIMVSPNGDSALNLLAEFATRPGKRLRGALAMVTYEMFGGTNHQTALDLALAVELTQDYLLIVDDVMDRSKKRRGLTTVHRQYYEFLKNNHKLKMAEHLGNMMGLSVGLITQHLAARILSEINDDPEHVLRAQQLFHANIAATAFGQMDDLMNQAGERFTIEDTLRMYVLKSGYYTFVNPMQLGAVLAGAQEEQLTPIRVFGEYAGLAFQLQDDLLGMFGDETVTGKSPMDDLHEGKMTLLIQHALLHASGDQRHQLRTIYGNKNATPPQHTTVRSILIELGSRNYVATQARKAMQAGLGVLSTQGSWSVKGKQSITELLEYAINRKS